MPDLIWGGKEDCEHQWGDGLPAHHPGQVQDNKAVTNENAVGQNIGAGSFCSLCSAWQGQLGLEPTPEMYVAHTIEILRLIWRVMRKDGVIFWDIGSSYISQPSQVKKYRLRQNLTDEEKAYVLGELSKFVKKRGQDD